MRERERERERNGKTTPAAFSRSACWDFFFFFQVFSSSVYWLGEDCCLCLPDSCMLHVPVELSHTYTHTQTHTHFDTLETSPLCSGVCISGSISPPSALTQLSLCDPSPHEFAITRLFFFTPYCLLIRPLRSQVAFAPRAAWQTSFLPGCRTDIWQRSNCSRTRKVTVGTGPPKPVSHETHKCGGFVQSNPVKSTPATFQGWGRWYCYPLDQNKRLVRILMH